MDRDHLLSLFDAQLRDVDGEPAGPVVRNAGAAGNWILRTLPAWRRRGIYRALVAHRAGLAAERGFRYLQVDASDDSRPILERLGFVPITTTTPYVWHG